MTLRRSGVVTPKVVKVVAAVVVGLSVGALLPPEPVSVPLLGPVPAVAVGGVGLVVGAVLYLRVPDLVGVKGCGCTGDCDCA